MAKIPARPITVISQLVTLNRLIRHGPLISERPTVYNLYGGRRQVLVYDFKLNGRNVWDTLNTFRKRKLVVIADHAEGRKVATVTELGRELAAALTAEINGND